MPEEELNNLARIGQLNKVFSSAALLQKMLATARNLSDYDGELVTGQALQECLQQADALCHLAEQQFKTLTNKTHASPVEYAHAAIKFRPIGHRPRRRGALARAYFDAGGAGQAGAARPEG